MKTTEKTRVQVCVVLDGDIRQAIRKEAFDAEQTMTQVINDRLRQALRLPPRKIPQTSQS